VALYIPLHRSILQYEDSGITRTRAAVAQPLLWGIRTTELRKSYLESVMADARATEGSYIFAGQVRHIFDYLAHQDGTYSASFWSDVDDDEYVRDTQRYLVESRVETVFLVPGYPERLKFCANKLEGMLARSGYALRKEMPAYRIYQRGH
jgi:hypothetical protein